MRKPVASRSLLVAGLLFISLATSNQQPATAFAESPSDYTLQMARVDYYLRKQETAQAAQELGRVPKELQSDPLFQKYAAKVMTQLYGPQGPRKIETALPPGSSQNYFLHQVRLTHRKKDSDRLSDQTLDNRGFQVNDHLEADVQAKERIRAKFVMDLDGYKNGHNDLRYRTLLADFYEGPNHLAMGDTATATSPYFLRASRLRGLHLLLPGDSNEFQAVVGAYPVWLEDRDEYVYPRSVWGLRDRIKSEDERFKFGAALVQSRDNGKLRTEDTANAQARVDPIFKTRDNIVVSLDQELKILPEVWSLKAAQAYSTTDEGLDEDRFGDTTQLKDTSFQVESLLLLPAVRSTSTFLRNGPDFRFLTDLPQGSVTSPKDMRGDIQQIVETLDFRPVGPLDLDLEGSWVRNNLDQDDNIETTRQNWYTADLGILVPPGWPKPRFRGTLFDTISSPGPTSRPAQTRTLDLRAELTHFYEGIQGSVFTEYDSEEPMADKESYSQEERWGFGGRLGTTLLERILVSPHYTYRIADEDFGVSVVDAQVREIRERGHTHEAGLSTSTRLWSSASLGLSYTFLHGKLGARTGTRLSSIEDGHLATANFSWPYYHYTWNKKRRFSLFPSLNYYLSDLNPDLELRPLLTGRLTLGYEEMDQWKLELMGEYREDADHKISQIETEESRVWLLWTSKWK